MSYEALDVEEVLHETDKSFLFRIDGAERWVPKSAMENPTAVAVGDCEVVVDIAAWLVRKMEDE